jgi:hypothetical protein
MLSVLQRQRDAALNELALLSGQVAEQQAQIVDLQKQIEDAKKPADTEQGEAA